MFCRKASGANEKKKKNKRKSFMNEKWFHFNIANVCYGEKFRNFVPGSFMIEAEKRLADSCKRSPTSACCRKSSKNNNQIISHFRFSSFFLRPREIFEKLERSKKREKKTRHSSAWLNRVTLSNETINCAGNKINLTSTEASLLSLIRFFNFPQHFSNKTLQKQAP